VAFDGTHDLERAAAALAARVPERLAPLARLAFNYRWTWTPGVRELFRSLSPDRYERVRANPVRLLQESAAGAVERAGGNKDLVARAVALEAGLRDELARPFADRGIDPARPVAFLCAEFGLHRSLPIYSGGLGVLAGDLLKEASDLALPLVGVGILYREGAFRQRVDASGWQRESWQDVDPERLPAALVTGEDGRPVTVSVPIYGREVTLQAWRVQVGRVPLFLLDADRPENDPFDRWITRRLYVGDRHVRLAQYLVLGLGAVRMLRALGIDPGTIHLNEGHVAFAPLELLREAVADGAPFDDAVEHARSRTVFTTHTPIAAGNESFPPHQILEALGELPKDLGTEPDRLLDLGRVRPGNGEEAFGLTPLGIRLARASNGVSRRHGEVSRGMWHAMFPGRAVEDVPIGHVTNGVHLPTWMAAPMRELLDRSLGEGWWRRGSDPATWEAIDDVPDADLWAVRCELRRRLAEYLRERSITERLARGEPAQRVEARPISFDPDALTLGFARRVTPYKRLSLLVHDVGRGLRLIEGPPPVQLVLAGKAHPQDEDGKRMLQQVLGLEWALGSGARAAFLEDYDVAIAARMVAGCDVWVNLPRPPLEASGTSGMKAGLNGCLNLSVLDGWWAEAFDGANGWAIDSDPALAPEAQDVRDADALYSLLEEDVVPLFMDRDEQGVPHGWVRRVKASLRTVGPRFAATRMLDDYVAGPYRTP
jgi:starch phosphorylase